MSEPTATNTAAEQTLHQQFSTLSVAPSTTTQTRQRRTILDDLSDDDSEDDDDFVPESDDEDDEESDSDEESDEDESSELEQDNEVEEDVATLTQEAAELGGAGLEEADRKVLRTGKTIKVAVSEVEITVETTAVAGN
ncbi:hypothetical protein BGZ83_004397 [Gryganskiella cystojenkinii]|nr:hypothetical protein BGZ83_004397 [Gryganskiella cystojenkinii]